MNPILYSAPLFHIYCHMTKLNFELLAKDLLNWSIIWFMLSDVRREGKHSFSSLSFFFIFVGFFSFGSIAEVRQLEAAWKTEACSSLSWVPGKGPIIGFVVLPKLCSSLSTSAILSLFTHVFHHGWLSRVANVYSCLPPWLTLSYRRYLLMFATKSYPSEIMMTFVRNQHGRHLMPNRVSGIALIIKNLKWLSNQIKIAVGDFPQTSGNTAKPQHSNSLHINCAETDWSLSDQLLVPGLVHTYLVNNCLQGKRSPVWPDIPT